jgi:SAM-dependent methyltransferase
MKTKSHAYDTHVAEYDSWFDKHSDWFQSEVMALKKVIPVSGQGIEVGIGTGRFAKPLGITKGIEPSANMASLAKARGLTVINGVAEQLPYQNESLDFVVMITVDCFLDDLTRAFQEIYRVLKTGGSVIIGMIDKSSTLGKVYETKKKDNIFYCDATFHSVEELVSALKKIDFHSFQYWQTLRCISTEAYEEPKPGHGEGGFVVIHGLK